MDTDDELRKIWKIERDVKHRGYSVKKIEEQIESRKSDAKKYIKTQSNNADIIISFFLIKKNKNLNIKINSNIDVESFTNSLNNLYGFQFDYRISKDYHLITFTKGISKDDTERIAFQLIPDLEDIISNEPKWESGFNGIIQLVQLLSIKNSLNSE